MLRIAVVEDNPAEAQLLQMALRETGVPMQVVLLKDGVEAVEYLSRNSLRCDLVLLDLNLPRLSGFEVLEHLKRQDEFRHLPIVVLSGSSDPADIERCYRAGANSYICKPVHLDEIFDKAAQLIAYWSKCVKIPSRIAEAVRMGGASV
jgi:CheY-like chemotaxis protein